MTVNTYFNLQNHPTFHSKERLVNLAKGRECFLGLYILLVYATGYLGRVMFIIIISITLLPRAIMVLVSSRVLVVEYPMYEYILTLLPRAIMVLMSSRVLVVEYPMYEYIITLLPQAIMVLVSSRVLVVEYPMYEYILTLLTLAIMVLVSSRVLVV